ncbi:MULTISPECIES: ImmA/IrrE family metallo-endopeptidase [Corynebacterium]|nr:ImmA/IrrE family metallo-endopeptidase [Corynebacterium kefirresidentii]MCG7241946.1 ImmA/IrrE family metallo-endopeptidase [Corynebacterium kefirresidentii]MCG7284302.1 ImmA/IrrE family metallo-endopeptidase [Corynebacterium kefirresidentii]MDK8837561.1 ImmA/IrrE family metallo-endopeptidase [Corynebacterium kefirresidentii]MDN8634551.1 ImmA/IrrE family metallo-endopeptidase [Corynebacterium kefirresidentii]MDN8642076.1 ImmA/IrrE family metallo-endopeptidase [Corynebacterium kefirresidenti
MTISAVELHLLAESMGVQLQRHSGGRPGWYDHHRRIISTRRGQSISQYKSVLAHELGHAHYGDTPTGNGHYDQRQEQRADEYAAHLLINPADFEASAIWHQDCLPAIADDLEVTHHLLKIWMELFQSGKLNSLTYANL